VSENNTRQLHTAVSVRRLVQFHGKIHTPDINVHVSGIDFETPGSNKLGKKTEHQHQYTKKQQQPYAAFPCFQ
jgi:hypothetical protein